MCNVADVINRMLGREILGISDWDAIKRVGIVVGFLFNVLS